MLRVTTLYASSAVATANYYTRYLAQAPGEVPGMWTGRQAAGLGLTGTVDADALQALLEGHDRVTGTRLGHPLADRTLADGRVVKAVAGFDATFSAPKSLSALWALTQDSRLLDAHDAAVTAALAHLEQYGATTRVRADGRRLHPDSQGLTIATFRQTTSRADDPQIHTHAVISAKVQTLDDRWLALDARYLKKHQRMLGGLYQSVLRNEVVHRFGLAWEQIENGQAEIAGLPPELLQIFSKRTFEVDAALADKIVEFRDREERDPTRWERAALTREAAVDTRGHKTGNGVVELVTRWASEAEAVGWSGPTVVDRVVAASRAHGVEPPDRVTVDDVVEALSAGGSTWNRAHIMTALCDVKRPIPSMTGEQWAAALERACDTVIAACVELDPTDATAPRRRSDGRSMWIEPIAPHVTSDRILAEEDFVLSWAMDAQSTDPRPSTTVRTEGLDVLQADVAAAVAGNDQLVLAVGPAGAGKTTTLRSAVADLHANGRAVFGIAPSAKAARVLERETGVPADTLAKLLYEWERPDRAPHDRYRLPAGATVLVDEAGMVGTPALALLVALADRNDWRLVLVGDHHQLQAVGRGGLFHEMCTTGRAIELTRIHRFAEPWEAAASLLLRRGDPRGVDAYIEHGRVIADTFDNHLDTIAAKWLTTFARNGTAAVTTSTNEHVDAINSAVQRARLQAGYLDEPVGTPIGGGERAHLGDFVFTRRNDRYVTTTGGEPVRNRELWTVTGIHDDGSLTVSSQLRSGTATLATDYVREHVRLGYAATEHGNQSDTVTIGVELATGATTRRGLYVGVTRGIEENLILVVTENGDMGEARDVLEGILASDRADVPATTQRRVLAEADRVPGGRPVRPEPRCEIPSWFAELRSAVHAELDEARVSAAADAKQLEDLNARLAVAKEQRAIAERGLDPHRPRVDAAGVAVQAARERQWSANNAAFGATGRKRRAARREVEAADRNYAAAAARLTEVEALVAPARAECSQAASVVRDVESSISSAQILNRLTGAAERAEQLQDLVAAVDGWHEWACGQPIRRGRLIEVARVLTRESDFESGAARASLVAALDDWAIRACPDWPTLRRAVEPPSQPLGIDM